MNTEAFYSAMGAWLVSKPAITARVGTRVYGKIAPRTAATPFVIVGLNQFGRTYETQIPQVEADLTLKAVVDMDQGGTLLLSQLVDALASATDGYLPMLSGSLWTVDWYQQRSWFEFTESVENRLYGYGGLVYHFRATKKTTI